MKEKLLALLVAKFAGVSEAMLEGIATKKAGSVSDESQLQSIVDGIDFGQVLQSNLDSKITDSNKKAIQNYEATHKLKNGKPVENPNPDPNPGGDPNDIATIVANAIKTAVEPLQQKIDGFEKEKHQETYISKAKVQLKGKNVPDSFWSKRNVVIESDDQLETVVSEIETDWTTFRQEQIDAGVMIDKPASSSGSNSDSQGLANEIEEGTKEIVEQQKK